MKVMQQKFLNIVRIYCLLLTFLLPLKLASLVGIPETTALFSSDLLVLTIVSWPVMLFPVMAGVLLLTTAMLPRPSNFSKPTGIYTASWVVLFAICLLGIINASTWDFVFHEVVHVGGLAALALGVNCVLQHDPEMGKKILVSVIAGAVVTALLGVQQYFTGFDETLEYMKQQAAYSDMASQGTIQAFLKSNRIFSTFALPNTLAGYILLAGPLCVMACWKICEKVDPPKVSRAIFVPLISALLLFVFIFTKSRAAFLSLGAALALFIILAPMKHRYRAVIITFGLLVLAGGIIYIKFSSRGFSSIIARLDYNLVSMKILGQHPLLGTGWGDFFHDYMLLNYYSYKEAPHTPHSFIMAFATQTGIGGLLAAIFVMLYPIITGLRRLLGNGYRQLLTINGAILFGLVAWSIHSLTDVNLQVPASAGIAIILSLCLLRPYSSVTSEDEDKQTKGRIDKVAKYLYIPLVAIIAITTLYGGMRLLCGEYLFSQLSELCDFQDKTREEFMKISSEQVKYRLRETVKAMPWSPFPWATAGRFMQARGYLSAAEDFYHRASELSPQRSAFYYRLYKIQTEMGKYSEAQKNLETARRLFPNNEKYKEN